MATPVFAVRASSTNAYFSNGNKVPSIMNSAYVTVVSNATPLSGYYLDITDTTKVKAIIWDGFKNTSNTRSFSLLLRFAPNYTGAPAARRSIWQISTGVGTSSAYLEMFHEVTSGNLYVIGKNEAGSATFATVNLGAWTTNTSGTYYDLHFAWDGTTTANAGKLYIDNVLLGAGGTATNAMLAGWDNTMWKAIMLGASNNATVSAYKVDEFVIWDGANDPNSTALVGGNGALNGAARTALVDVSKYNGPAQYSRGRIVNA